MADTKYFSLQPEAFLAEFVGLTTAERGAYASICFWMYANNGRAVNDLRKLSVICGSPKNFNKLWLGIRKKFRIRGGYIYQKRVQKEYEVADQLRQGAVIAGHKGALIRWGGHKGGHAKPIANDNDKGKGNNTFYEAPGHVPVSKRLCDTLANILGARPNDKKSLTNFATWVDAQILAGRFSNEVFKQIFDIANDVLNARKPIAVFFKVVGEDLGYKSRARKRH